MFAFSSGVAIEISHLLLGRGFGIGDLITNTAGIAAGSALWAAISNATSRTSMQRFVCLASTIVILLICFARPLAIVFTHSSSPTVADFEKWGSLLRATSYFGHSRKIVAAPERWKGNKSRVLRIGIGSKVNSRTTFHEPLKDWTRFKTFEFQAYLPETVRLKVDTRLLVMIRDHRHSISKGNFHEYLQHFNLNQGANTLKIDLESVFRNDSKLRPRLQVDWSDIKEIVIITKGKNTKIPIYYDNFKLQ